MRTKKYLNSVVYLQDTTFNMLIWEDREETETNGPVVVSIRRRKKRPIQFWFFPTDQLYTVRVATI